MQSHFKRKHFTLMEMPEAAAIRRFSASHWRSIKKMSATDFHSWIVDVQFAFLFNDWCPFSSIFSHSLFVLTLLAPPLFIFLSLLLHLAILVLVSYWDSFHSFSLLLLPRPTDFCIHISFCWFYPPYSHTYPKCKYLWALLNVTRCEIRLL